MFRYLPTKILFASLLLLVANGCALHVSDGHAGTDIALTPFDGYKPSAEETSGYVADFSGRYTGSCIQYLGAGKTSRTCGATLEVHESAGSISMRFNYSSSESYSSDVSTSNYWIRGNSIYSDLGYKKGDIGAKGITLYDPTFGEISIRSLGVNKISVLINTLPNQPYLASAVDYQLSASLSKRF